MMTRKHSHTWYIVVIVVLAAVASGGAFQFFSLQQERDALGGELSALDGTLSALQSDLSQTRDQLDNAQSRAAAAQSQLDGDLAILRQFESQRNAVDAEYAALVKTLTTDHTYKLADPSYAEVESFIRNVISKHKYNSDDYIAANAIIAAANQLGFRCGLVGIIFGESHQNLIVVLNTAERGLIFVEPWSVTQVKLQVGKSYWGQCVDPPPGSAGWLKPGYDDTVVSYVLVW